jgi:hypothetical protein
MALKDWKKTEKYIRDGSGVIGKWTKTYQDYPPKILAVIERTYLLSTEIEDYWVILNTETAVLKVTKNKSEALKFAKQYMRTH